LKSLYLRIYLTVVVALALFAIGSGWLFQREVMHERTRQEAQAGERLSAWADLLQNSLPPADAPPEEQARALGEWSQRLRLPMALDAQSGARLAASESYLRRTADAEAPRGLAVRLDDGRVLWVLRGMGNGPRGMGNAPRGAGVPGPGANAPPWLRGAGLAALLVLLFLAVAAGAFPVVRRLTRRLESLKQGVQRFGEGALGQRVDASGKDEVAAVAASFNQAAERIEVLVNSHKSLLANASHELRSPLARMRMALSLMEDGGTPTAQRERLAQELRTNIGELDALVEEVLLASRLDAQAAVFTPQPVDVIALAAEEAAQVGAEVQAQDARLMVQGDERLLRRALRNLLENARRYGVSDSGTEGPSDGELHAQRASEITPHAQRASGITLHAQREGTRIELRVCDRGPGVPEALRQRIFEPFFRLPGHAEREGGVGLGLALVRQIAQRHHGSVRCEDNPGGGGCFVLSLPASA
jgi:signal transduction histidine kinase